MAHERHGPELEGILADLVADGFEISGEQLKTSPRGYAADHPRIELLRRKQLMAGKRYGFEADAIGPGLLDRVRDDWRALRPLVTWLASNAVGQGSGTKAIPRRGSPPNPRCRCPPTDRRRWRPGRDRRSGPASPAPTGSASQCLRVDRPDTEPPRGAATVVAGEP